MQNQQLTAEVSRAAALSRLRDARRDFVHSDKTVALFAKHSLHSADPVLLAKLNEARMLHYDDWVDAVRAFRAS
jgi:hypothetical protein